MSLTSLREEYDKCMRCPELCQGRIQVVFGEGNETADVLLVGEAPGKQESIKGIPFCGMSGKILDELLEHINLKREDIFITNTVLCRPPNNRDPTQEEMDNCADRLERLLQIMQPKVIVTIGRFATKRILGKDGITQLRGNVFNAMIGKQTVKVVPVVHPASYLYSGRNPEKMAQMKADFSTIAQVINDTSSQKRLGDF